jgi:preprotein translocase subunit SecE
MNAILQFINESIEELRQVRWPTRQQAVRLSILVLGFTIASAAFFGFVDFLLSQLMQLVLSLAV